MATGATASAPSTSLRLVGRYAALAFLVLALASLHLRHRPASLCVLRTVTGVPCPFCGGTTAAVRLGHADLRGSLAASPIAAPMMALWPLLGVVRSPTWWQPRRVRWTAIIAVLAVAEVWQLARFGFIGGLA